MFGNKFAANELARNFQKEIEKRNAFKKKANAEVSDVKPEDFLVSSEAPHDIHSEELNKNIDQISSYAKDVPCEKCNEIHDSKSCNYAKDDVPCEKCHEVHEGECKTESKAEDMSYLVDKKAEYVLFNLGKIANQLRKKNKGFAADMVEATALEIKEKTVKTAAQKLQVISGLTKMANDSYKKGDTLTGDVISVTIENIKKS